MPLPYLHRFKGQDHEANPFSVTRVDKDRCLYVTR